MQPFSIIKNKVYHFEKVEEDKYQLVSVAKFYFGPIKNGSQTLNLVFEDVSEVHIKELEDGYDLYLAK